MMNISVHLLQGFIDKNNLDKNTALLADNYTSDTKKETGINSNVFFKSKELAKELKKSIIKKFGKWNVQPPFIGNIWATDLSIIK